MTEYGCIKQLRPFKKPESKMVFHIDRLWEVFPLGKSTVTGIGMILIDKNGDQIHASVPKSFISTYSGLLNEGDIIILSEFNIQTKDTYYCPIDKPFEIMFKEGTNVEQGDKTLPFPARKLMFIDFQHVEARVENPSLLLDVIGLLIKVDKDIKTIKTRVRDSPKQEIRIINERYILS